MDDAIALFRDPQPIAVVGASANPHKFGFTICKTLKERGFAVYAVNPGAAGEGKNAYYKSLRDIPDGVEAAVVCIRPEKAEQLVDDAAARGIGRIWFQQGADFSNVAAEARGKGIATVIDKCILMYTEPVTGIHKVHRFLWKLIGKY